MKKRQTISIDEVLTHIAEKVTEVLKRRGVPSGTVAAAAVAVSDGIPERTNAMQNTNTAQLIPIATQAIAGEERQAVNARELHTFLEVGKDFSN